MAVTEDMQLEQIPLVASTENVPNGSGWHETHGTQWQDTVHLQLMRSTRVLVHLYIVKLVVRLTVSFLEGSLQIYSVDVWKFDEGQEVLLLNVYEAISPCLPLVGGILADTLIGTTKTTIGGIVNITLACVMFMLCGISYEDVFDNGLPLLGAKIIFLIGLILLFFGVAGFESNIDPLAAKHKERKGYSAVRTVYHSLFWFETIGIAVAIVINDAIEDELNFSLFYGIGSILMLAAIIVIALGLPYYIPTCLPKENVLYKAGAAIMNSISRRIKRKDLDVPNSEEITSFLDYSKIKHGGKYEERHMDSIKHLLSTLPVFHTITLYSIVYYQVDNSFKEQTRRMNLAAGSIAYPNITFPLVSAFVIIITIPFLLYLYPKLDNSDRFKLTPLRKIGIGIVFAGLALVSAAIVETERKQVMDDGGYFNQTVNDITYNASRLNVLYQVPQFTFIGISEAVIRTSGSELSFTQSPDNMKGIVMGIYLLMSGLGSYLINLLITLGINSVTSGNKWITEEMNDGYYEGFFYILTGMQIFDLFYLYMISRNYSYKPTECVKTVYQHVKFDSVGGVTVLESVEGESGNVVPSDWEYVGILQRKSLPRCKMQYGTDDPTNPTNTR